MGKHTTARTYQFKATLTKDGHRRLDATLRMSATLYNAALQERRDAWKMAGVGVSLYDPDAEFHRRAPGYAGMGGPGGASGARRVGQG